MSSLSSLITITEYVFHSAQQVGHEGYFWDISSVTEESSKSFPHFAQIFDIDRFLDVSYFIVCYFTITTAKPII